MAKFPYAIMLDNVRSALNVGAIFRTCDAAGASKLYLTGITPYPPHNRIPKTALGAIEFVDWERHIDGLALLEDLKSKGWQVVVVEQSDKSVPYNTVEFQANTVLVFGHEIHGVEDKIIELADQVVELPMFGQKESLNVATTVGIMAYHLSLGFEDRTEH
jgi:23S rRNA (guanosine2251-2'-O)-methyltransferase